MMKARVVWAPGSTGAATDWTDTYPIGSTRDIDLRKHPDHAGRPFQVEVDATLGKTDRSQVLFQSILDGVEPLHVQVNGATQTFSIDVE
jgi:hypothetical protein